MRVLITGASGFIGSRLMSSLSAEGMQMLGVDRSSGVDLLDQEAVQGLSTFNPEVIVHLAARSFVPHSFEYPREFFQTNVSGTLNVLELARITGARFVFLSSYVYGIPQRLPIDEEHPLAAINPYGESKLLGEHLCRSYSKYHNVPCTILRPFNVYGAGQDANFLIPSIIGQARSGRVNLKDPRPRRDFIYVDDVVRAIRAAIDFMPKQGIAEAFNVGYGISHSLQEVLDAVQSAWGASLDIYFSGETRPNEVLDTVSDIAKAEQLLNWKPIVSLDEGILKMISSDGGRN